MEDLKERLRALPPQLAVAFAARCGRRVQPLYRFERVDTKHIATLESALHDAENYALGVTSYSVATDAVFEVGHAAGHAAGGVDVDAYASAAAAAAYAAAYASASTNSTAGNASTAAENAFSAYETAYAACSTFVAASAASSSADADLVVLESLASAGEGHVDPTPAGPLGPYWPVGQEPEWWPRKEQADATAKQVKDSDPAPLIAVNFGDGFSEEEMEACLSYVSEVYRDLGGTGLKIVNSQSMAPDTVEADND